MILNNKKCNKYLHVLIILNLFMFIFVPSFASGQIQPDESVMLVIDASGSMSGNKIVDAKNAAATFLDSIKGKNVEVGLMAFYDCTDIQVLHGLTGDFDSVKNKLSPISPYGGTPIADSILSAGNVLKQSAKGKKGRIILLTDGGESCGGNCEQASDQVKQIEIDVTLNIIGIEIPDSTIEEQLKEIADSYTPVEDSGGLSDIVVDIGKEIGDTLTVSKLTITPSSAKMKQGEIQQVTVTASMSDGTTKDMTSSSSGIVYTSSNVARATVTEDGLVEIPANATNGPVYIRATYGGITVASTITVEVPTMTGWSITNPNTSNLTMKPGDSLQIGVTGTMSDGETVDLTPGSSGTTYVSSNTSRATVTAEGLIEIPSNAPNGIVYVRVYRGSEMKPLTITVKAPEVPTISKLSISPSSVKMKPGDSQQVTVTATMSDGTTKDMTLGSSGIVYTSSNIARATVTPDGFIEIPANSTNGPVYIRATHSGKTVTTTITVEGPTLTGWNIINPNTSNLTMNPGDSLQIQVTGTMSDGTTVDLTDASSGTTYVSSNTSRATVTADGLIEIPSNAPNGIVYVRVYRGSEMKPLTITVKTP
jgi:uncharacterized protein YegL